MNRLLYPVMALFIALIGYFAIRAWNEGAMFSAVFLFVLFADGLVDLILYRISNRTGRQKGE